MTQALLNNLNNFYDNICSADKPCLGDFSKKFDKILDLKTVKETAEKFSEADKQQVTVQKEENIQNYTESTQEVSDNCKPNRGNDEKTVSQETFDEFVINAAAESIIEDTITSEKQISISDELLTEDENMITITEEEPTMQKELALENPTMAEMLLNLKMQIPQSVLEQSENTETDSIVLNTSPSEDSAEEAPKEFKFDIKEELSLKEDKNLDDIIDQEIIDDLSIESVTSETTSENAGQNSFMQNQSPQEQMTKIMIQGDVSYEDMKFEGINQNGVKTEVSSGNILEQITKQMEGMYNNSRVNIVLNPQALGKVTLQILNSKEGLTAQFFVSNDDVKNILLKGLNNLKENLISQGVAVDNITVKLNESEMYNSESTEDWTEQEGSRGGNKEQNPKRQKQDEKLFEQTMFEINNKNT